MPESLSILATFGLMGLSYATGVRRIWARAGRGRVVREWQIACFVIGLVSSVGVLVGPLDLLSNTYLWAHMTQHMVLIVIASPLLAVGAPLPALLWALPPARRQRPASLWRRVQRSAAGPSWWAWAAAAFFVHALALWAWHIPSAYGYAIHHAPVHLMEHASYLGTGVFFWWSVISAQRRATYGLGVLVVFLMAFQGTALGAWMTIANTPWYGAYSAGHHSLSAMDDQQLAGVIMWCPGGFAYLAAAAALFYAWVAGEERRNPAYGPVLASTSSP